MINRITAYLAMAGGFIVTLLFAIARIRKGGADAQRAKDTQATLENVAIAKKVRDDINAMSDDAKRDELFKDFTRK